MNIEFGSDSIFVYDEKARSLVLKKLFGMACGHNGANAEDFASGLCVFCINKQRYEGSLLSYTCSWDAKAFRFTAQPRSKECKVRFESEWLLDELRGIIRCKSRLCNDGKESVTVRRAFPRWVFSPGDYSVYSQRCNWSGENQGDYIKMQGPTLELKAFPAHTSLGAAPYAMLKDMETGDGVAFHVIPAGNWKIKIHPGIISNLGTRPVVEAGMSDEDLFAELAAEEILEMPDVLLQKVPDGKPENAAPGLHEYIAEHLEPDNVKVPPVVYNSWIYKFTNFSLDEMRAQLAAAKEIGCETFIIDAGWNGLGDWTVSQGDWRERPDGPFQGNMGLFAEEVRAAGLKFGFWIDPENWQPTIPVRKEHPQWFPDNSIRIDLTIPEAAEHFYHIMADNIRKFGAEHLTVDFNTPLGYDKTGTELHEYWLTMMKTFRRLRQDFPNLTIENCAAGTLRTELATTALFDMHFLSDNVHPFEGLRMKQGALLRLNPMRIMSWRALRPAPEEYTQISDDLRVLCCAGATWDEAALFTLDYTMASGLFGVLGFTGELAKLPAPVLERLKEYVDFYKENRSWMVRGKVFSLTPQGHKTDYECFMAFQLQSEDNSHGLLYVFTNSMTRRCLRYFKLHNLTDNHFYQVKRLFGEAEVRLVSGHAMMNDGLEVTLPENMHVRHYAAIFEYKEK